MNPPGFVFNLSTPYGPLWSLAVEEHFYLFWPTLLRTASRRAVGVIALLILVASPLVRWFGFTYGDAPAVLEGFRTWYTLDGLAMGSFIAVFVRETGLSRAALLRLSIGLTLAGLVMLGGMQKAGMLARSTWDTTCGGVIHEWPWILLFGGILSFFLLVGSGPRKKWVRISFLQFVGYISYGFYLYHSIVMEASDRYLGGTVYALPENCHSLFTVLWRCTVIFALSCGVAWISRRYFEEAFLKFKDRFWSGTRKSTQAVTVE